METILEQLESPVVKDTDFGSVSLTHRCWGFTHQPWSIDAQVVSYYTLSILDGDNKFKPYPGTEDYCYIRDNDYTILQGPNDQGKKTGVFRTDDIISYHKTAKGLL